MEIACSEGQGRQLSNLPIYVSAPIDGRAVRQTCWVRFSCISARPRLALLPPAHGDLDIFSSVASGMLRRGSDVPPLH